MNIRPARDPIVHFAIRSNANNTIHAGPALCRAGWIHRAENDQRVTGEWAGVTCRNCHRIRAAENRREARAKASRDI